MYFQYLAARKGGPEPFRNACDGSGSFEEECLTGSWNTAVFKTDSEEGGSDFYIKVGWFGFPAVDGWSADVSILCGTLGQYLNPSVANAHLDGNQEVFGLTITSKEANKKMQEAQAEVLSGEK